MDSAFSQLQRTIMRFRRDIERAEGPARSQIILAYEQAILELEYDLYAVMYLIEDARASGIEPNPDWLYRQQRYRSLIEKAEGQLERFGVDAQRIVQESQFSGIRLGANHAMEIGPLMGFRGTFGQGINTRAVDKVYQLMFDADSPLQDVFASYSPYATSIIRHRLGQGIIQGQSPREVVRDILDTLTSGTNQARLSTLIRTEHMRAYRLSQEEQYKALGDAVTGYRWIAAKQTRTCLACLAMDGEIFDDYQHSMHPQCRCICTPLGRYTPAQYRQYQTGAEWFAQQSADVQRQMMPSQAAYDAYRRGDVQVSDFLGHRESDVWGTTLYERSGWQVLEGDN